MTLIPIRLAVLALALAVLPAASSAQSREAAPPSPPAEPAPPAAPDPPAVDEDEEGNPAIPDFTTINLPTTLRLPRHKVAFRVTHRFGRDLGEGSFSDLASDFFGFDSGAMVGLELRFGLFRGTQVGLYRTSDKTMQFFAQHDLVRQDGFPVGLAAFGTFEGQDNLKGQRGPGLALVASRTFGERAALYVIPAFVGNTNLSDGEGEDNHTVMLGLAGRVRFGSDYAIVAEAMPRLAGHEHQEVQLTFGFERRAGGHNFQLNFSNAVGSTLAQVARGGGAVQHDDHEHGAEEGRAWYIGFNLSRKFY